MVIRAMEGRDYPAYCTLLREVHALHAENRPDIYRKDIVFPDQAAFYEMLNDPDTVNLAAEEGGEVVGMCLMEIRQSKSPVVHQKPFGWISDLCVRSDWRGQGVGRALYAAAKERASAMGLARLELMVWAFNEDALDFYEKIGMSVRSRTMEDRL